MPFSHLCQHQVIIGYLKMPYRQLRIPQVGWKSKLLNSNKYKSGELMSEWLLNQWLQGRQNDCDKTNKSQRLMGTVSASTQTWLLCVKPCTQICKFKPQAPNQTHNYTSQLHIIHNHNCIEAQTIVRYVHTNHTLAEIHEHREWRDPAVQRETEQGRRHDTAGAQLYRKVCLNSCVITMQG